MSLLLFGYDLYIHYKNTGPRIRINVKYMPFTESTPSHLFVYLLNDGEKSVDVRTVRIQLHFDVHRRGKPDRARRVDEAMSLDLPLEDQVTPDLAITPPTVEPGQGGSIRYTFTDQSEEWLANHTFKGDIFTCGFIVVTTDTGEVWSNGVMFEPVYEGKL
jgi:hypothetical protein